MARNTKSIHPRVLEGRKDREEGKWHRGKNKVFKSVQAQGLANARKQLQKNLWSIQAHDGVKNPHTGVKEDSALHTPETKIPILQRREYAEDPWQHGSHLAWPPAENRAKSCHSLPPIPPVPSGGDSGACSSLQFGRRWMR